MKNKICGIYKILNIENGKFYIGSSKNIKHRWSQHKSKLKKGKHPNMHLQNAWVKYGSKAFSLIIIEENTQINDLIKREQYWLDELKPYNRNVGYNINKITTGSGKIRGICKIKNCGMPHFGKGYCSKHYTRFIRHGSVSDKSLIRHAVNKDSKCKVKNCLKPVSKKRYCNKHYNRLIKFGKVSDKCLTKKIRKNCKIKGCNGKHKSLGYCDKHYQRFIKYGYASDNCLTRRPPIPKK